FLRPIRCVPCVQSTMTFTPGTPALHHQTCGFRKNLLARLAGCRSPLVLLIYLIGCSVSLNASTNVLIREWVVPTPGTGPHDPAMSPDGALWYTGQQTNLLRRLDPATGEIRDYPLPTQASGPYGLVVDGDGHIRFTAYGLVY